MVIGHGLKLVAFGLVLGVGISYGVGRAIASLLYQTKSHDIVTFGTVPIVLWLIAVIACALPAYRASRVEPMGGPQDGMNPLRTGSVESISHYYDRRKAFLNATRHLKAGGVFALTDWFERAGLSPAQTHKFVRPIARRMLVQLVVSRVFRTLIEA